MELVETEIKSDIGLRDRLQAPENYTSTEFLEQSKAGCFA
jgi:hypothetical protein